MIDVQKLADRLKKFENEEKQSEASKHLWKPKEGLQTVRIVPYKFNLDSPFIELKFYYKLAGNNYLAPCTFGKPDPILEFVETLRSSGVQAQRELAKKLEPKSRTYAPVIVRGEEEQGVRYWGFGVTVYKQLLKLITNPKWGDITSLTEGNDLEIEFHKESKKKGKDGKSFPETNITPDPRKTPVVNPTRGDLVQKIKEQVDILTCWNLPEYADLKAAMDKFLNPEAAAEAAEGEAGDDVDETAAAPASVTPNPAPATTAAPATVAPSAPPEDLGQAFEDFFKK
jgi:hypothetical protein